MEQVAGNNVVPGSNNFWAQHGPLVFAIISYSVVSLSVVYFNWWVFTVGFRYPVFVSWVQQMVGFLLFSAGSWVGYYFTSFRVIFPAVQLQKGITWRVLPLTLSFVLMVGLANICLQKTLISTYQVARSLTLLFVMALSYLLLRERQSWIVLSACGLMVLGFMIGSMDPKTLSLGGLLAGGASSFFQSLYNVYIKKCLPLVQNDSQSLLYYNLLLSSALFLPMVLVSEPTQVWADAFGRGTDSQFSLWVIWGSMILSGVLGTTLNMTTYFTVKVTSPLTFNIIGFSKALVQSMGGIVFMGDAVSAASGGGIGLCLCGSLVYTKAKYDENKAKAADGTSPIPDRESDAQLDSGRSTAASVDMTMNNSSRLPSHGDANVTGKPRPGLFEMAKTADVNALLTETAEDAFSS